MGKKLLASFFIASGVTMGGLLALNNQDNVSASNVNNYIHSQNIKRNGINFPIWSGFPTDDMGYRNGKGRPEGVVVHETANSNSTIQNEIAFMKSNYNNAFVHTFVDDNNIINIADTDNMAWGSGAIGNQRYVQFEQVRVHSKYAFAREVSNAAYYTAYVLDHYGLKPSLATTSNKGKGATVLAHADVSNYLGGTDHSDPTSYYSESGKKWFNQAYTMSDLYSLIQEYYTDMNRATVNYNGGSGSETAKVIGGGYGLYNHVSNTPGSIQQGSASKLTGKEVYLDCVGEKSDGTTWYRIRAEGSSETYWVDGRALKFRPIDYSPVDSETVGTFDGSGSSLRSHVYNAASLSKSRGNANQYKNKTYKINQKAVITDYNGSTKTMYRVEIGNTTVWASSWALNVHKSTRVDYNGGSGSETAKVIGGGYGLYNHISNTPGSVQQGSASRLAGKEVYLDCVGDKSDGTTWYRIRAEGSSETYWVDGRALKFRPIDYAPMNTYVTFNGSGSSLRSHVYNAASLSKSRGNANQYKNKTYKINQKAVITDYNGSTKTMYRVEIGNTTVWASSWAVNVKK
ncbi:N-acetylmuramoyl-L-alanine amidase [Dellaglioa algida]|uniref:N-acetylmuramoyl-L-alanine amidase n=1 Tax=Dellaglioa algida TaxID=105612 RepID=UPI0024C4C378|nr:GW dipeptide domain-containing protein [Dellaglioa algida]MDK1724743.1 N-acetylmuramoyl-L-alanine amidase [Dellaglioa algida]MDK1738717.1 N-acetylmuramoyl-L-alanine amidase [Dellaglioa algida]